MLTLRRAPMIVAIVAAVYVCVGDAHAAGPIIPRAPGISQQYYEDHGTIGSRLYTSPRPVPAWVGNTYYTYQPFYPHKFLWSHSDHYLRRHPGGGFTYTNAYYW